jgi:phage-related protein
MFLALIFNGIILSHGFSKKGDKTPKGEIEKAEAIKREFENRECKK